MAGPRLLARLIVVLFLSLFGTFLLTPSANRARSQEIVVRVGPILRLEKPKYVLGEAIRFWVGAEPRNSAVIPQRLRKPCSLGITKPDGTTETEAVSWPIDGMIDHGWSGGWGFADDKVEAGSYVLVLECAGEKTKPLTLSVEKNEIMAQIKAEFHFERSGAITMGTPVPVALTVQNNSPQMIRFPQRGAMGEGVSLKVLRDNPVFRSDFFYPWDKLSNSPFSADTYRWNVADVIPSIVLRPGEHFEQQFLLADAYSFDRPGKYEVTFTTVLAVLVGDEGGPLSELCPIRVPVVAKEQFAVSDAR
jgi:hypothetical protein